MGLADLSPKRQSLVRSEITGERGARTHGRCPLGLFDERLEKASERSVEKLLPSDPVAG
jgi:hypothetical protein